MSRYSKKIKIDILYTSVLIFSIFLLEIAKNNIYFCFVYSISLLLFAYSSIPEKKYQLFKKIVPIFFIIHYILWILMYLFLKRFPVRIYLTYSSLLSIFFLGALYFLLSFDYSIRFEIQFFNIYLLFYEVFKMYIFFTSSNIHTALIKSRLLRVFPLLLLVMFIFHIISSKKTEKNISYFFFSFMMFIGIPFIFLGLNAINSIPLKKTKFLVRNSVLSIEMSRFLSTIFLFTTAGLIVFFYYILYKSYQAQTKFSELEKRTISRQRLEELGKLTAGIAHEINNSLSSIAGFSELLLEKEDRSESRKYLEIICDESYQLRSRLSEILGFSRQNSEAACIDILECIDGTINFLESNKKFDEVKINKEDVSSGKVWINNGEFKQVIMNLLINSSDAMKYKGLITISGKKVEDKYILYIKDEGKGISNELKDKIFEPFLSGKEGGNGLGLFITRQIVLKYDGNIELEKTDNGCCFKLEFPICEELI